jgi:hypothetical protein
MDFGSGVAYLRKSKKAAPASRARTASGESGDTPAFAPPVAATSATAAAPSAEEAAAAPMAVPAVVREEEEEDDSSDVEVGESGRG